MTRTAEQIKKSRADARLKYGLLFDRVSAMLFEEDPIQINFETNTDEYEPEVETILPRLHQANSQADVVEIVHQEFCRWFSPEDAGPRVRYEAIATKIWKEWLARKQPEA